MTPMPIRPLTWLLRLVSSRAAAAATIGDMIEELGERRAHGRGAHLPAVWLNLQIVKAIAWALLAAAPRHLRSIGLTGRDAVRAIRAAPVHALFIVLVLAAGITLGTITFSVVDAVVLRPLPIEHPDRLVSIQTSDQAFKQRITPELFWRLHDHLGSVEEMAARFTVSGAMIRVGRVTDEGSVARATADMFRILRLSPAMGRVWTAEEEARGETGVAVLGYRFWREQLGGDPSILGSTVSVDALKPAYTVIGVLSAASDHPEVDLTSAPVWVPLAIPRTGANVRFGIQARMRPGVSSAQVADEVQQVTAISDWRPDVTPLLDTYVSPVRHWMLLALCAAGLVVLIACANAANLMLTRSAAREQEMAIRAALGASRRHIAMSVLIEGVLLSAGATAAALLFSVGAVRVAKFALLAALPGTFRASTIGLDGRVLSAALACAVLTGVLFSLVPAWQTSRSSVSTVMKDAEALTATGRRRWRSLFLTAEIATVAVLLVVSWLFIMSLIRVVGIDLGIDRANLLAVNPRLEFQGTVDEVERRIALVRGVSGVAVSRRAMLPLVSRAFGGAWPTTRLTRADRAADGNVSIDVLENLVTPNYFAVAGLRFQRGGAWATETAGDSNPIVLDAQASRRLFGDDNPLGRQVRATVRAGIYNVVGVVPYVYAMGPEEAAPPSAYFNLKHDLTRRYAALFVRTSRPSDEMLPALTEALRPVAPALKEPFVFAVDHAVGRITATRRFTAQLMSVFGLVGMLIGAAGVYAVMASFVAQQTREIGVRVALGATPARIQRGVLAIACRHLVAGLALGVPVAWWLSRGLTALLFQVTPSDGSVYLFVAALLSAVALLAAWIPASRAARIDPILSLRR